MTSGSMRFPEPNRDLDAPRFGLTCTYLHLTRPVSAVADRIERIQDDESYMTGQRTRLH
jgi:hypothetical protein